MRSRHLTINVPNAMLMDCIFVMFFGPMTFFVFVLQYPKWPLEEKKISEQRYAVIVRSAQSQLDVVCYSSQKLATVVKNK